MSLFGKKVETTSPEQQPGEPSPLPHVHPPTPRPPGGTRPYGIADLILLMKSIPTDRHPELVLRVVRTTLESLGVRPDDIVEDALKHETAVRDRIAAIEGEIDGMVQEIERRRGFIAELKTGMAELVYARERWQSAEQGLAPAPDDEAGVSKLHTRPPPLPPPLHKPAAKASDALG